MAADEAPQDAPGDEAGRLAPEYPFPSATALSVEYPGFVRDDTEACLNTLGCGSGGALLLSIVAHTCAALS